MTQKLASIVGVCKLFRQQVDSSRH